jgi:phosphoglycerol transferase MdoB-like AlkP superfamily enzyme
MPKPITIDLYYFKNLLKILSVGLALHTLCRAYFWFNNQSILPQPTFFDFISALRFDLSASAYAFVFLALTCLIPLPIRHYKTYRQVQKMLFIVSCMFLLALELTDVAYFRFANRRIIAGDFGLIKSNVNALPNVLKEYFPFFAIILLIPFLLNFIYKKTIDNTQKTHPKIVGFSWLFQIAIFVLGLAFWVVILRGGLQLRPLTPLNAAEYASDVRLIPFVSNASLNVIHSYGQESLTEKNYFAPEVAHNTYPIFKQFQPTKPFRKLNVVVLALESTGKDMSKFFNQTEKNFTGYFPFLDSLVQQSHYTEYSFANGLRSTQGILALSAGLPSFTNEAYMFSPYRLNKLEGLAAHLGQKGYKTMFFHGSNAGSMDFENFSKLTGFQHFYDRFGYGNQEDFDGTWGIWDEKMYDFMLKNLNTTTEPFYSFFFSISSHHPFSVPDYFKKKYPDLEPQQRAYLYSDYALSQFFKAARNMPWFDNTLFVVSADHIGATNVTTSPHYRTPVGRYKIPIFFYKPNEIKPQKIATVSQQIDVMPYVLDFLNYEKPFLSFGRSVFNLNDLSSQNKYAFQYEEGIYQIEDKQYSLFFDGEKILKLFDYQNDLFLKNDLKAQTLPQKDSLLITIKSLIQQHNNIMIQNKMNGQ